MEEKDIKVISTTKGELRYYRDWDNFEGGIVMMNAQTVKRYREIKDQHPDADECGVFFAFSNQQFNEGYKHLIELGHIKDGDKIVRGVAGAFGTKEGLDKFYKFYEDRDTPIKEEYDPQEVYFYEYNNHESMIAWDGDLEAIKIVIDIWGADVARKSYATMLPCPLIISFVSQSKLRVCISTTMEKRKSRVPFGFQIWKVR